MIRPWLFEFFHSVHDLEAREDRERVNDQFQWYLDLWVGDEARGFEGLFFSEHHFGPTYSPSPNLIIAYLAGKTSTMRLGVLGTVTPYATPWRVFEEFAMLDHLTRGRLEMGVVSGIAPELEFAGLDPVAASEIHAEVLDVLDAAFGHRVVTHHGKHFHLENARLSPTLYQSAPSLWTAAVSESSARRSGARGHKLCLGFFDTARIGDLFDAYRDEARAHGKHVGPDHLAIRRQVAIVPAGTSQPEATRIAKEGYATVIQAEGEARRLRDAGPKFKLSEDEFVAGTAEQVAERLIAECQATGAGNVLLTFHPQDRGLMVAMHDEVGRVVAPMLREAKVSSGA